MNWERCKDLDVSGKAYLFFTIYQYFQWGFRLYESKDEFKIHLLCYILLVDIALYVPSTAEVMWRLKYHMKDQPRKPVMETTIPGLQGEHRRASLLVTYEGPPVPIESSCECFSFFEQDLLSEMSSVVLATLKRNG